MRKLAFFARASVLVGALLIVCQTASARLSDWARPGFHHHAWSHNPVARPKVADRDRLRVLPAPPFAEPIPVAAQPFTNWPNASWPIYTRPLSRPYGGDVRLTTYQPAIAPPRFAPPGFTPQPMLSPAARWVSEIAARNGDREFLMVDKARGKLFLFDNGAPIFTAPALTGASLADQLPPDALSKTIAQGYDLRYRVTPAGRYTVSPGRDHFYGDTLDINEIKGRNWIIAIHLAPNATRDARLRTPSAQDMHVTEGCINVTADTMRELVRLLARRTRTPLYILPMDDNQVSRFLLLTGGQRTRREFNKVS